jgi:hypothetical protein
MMFSRTKLAAAMVFIAAAFFASSAQARWVNPWGLGATVMSGYTVTTPSSDLSRGAFLGGGLELRYTSSLGVGATFELGFSGAFWHQPVNPFDHDAKLFALPMTLSFLYEYPGRNLRPFATVGFGYTYWQLDRSGVSNDNLKHRMNMTGRVGLGYRVWEEIFITGALVVLYPNLFSGSESPSLWIGGQVGTLWRF